MQHNVVLGQIIVQNSTMMYYIHNVYENTCQLHKISPTGNKSCLPFHIWPPLPQLGIIIHNGGVFGVVIQHFSKSSPIPPWSLCGWQGIWWHLDVRTSMPRLPLIIVYMFFTYHPFLVSSSLIQLCLGCDWSFDFTPCTSHHNHLTMETHLLWLESITHHGFQFGLKGFERLFPSMVQASLYFLTNSSRI